MDINIILFLYMIACSALASLSSSEHLKVAFIFSTAGTGILLFRGSATWPIALAVFMLAHTHYALSHLRYYWGLPKNRHCEETTRKSKALSSLEAIQKDLQVASFFSKKSTKAILIFLYILLCAICLAFPHAVLYPVAALYACFLLTHAGIALWKGNFCAKIGALAFVGCDISEFLRQAIDLEWWWAWVFFGPSMFFLALSGFKHGNIRQLFR
jgi:hypothetical protein